MMQSVLIVDDEPAILFGYSRYLKKADYDVTEASCLAEARKTIDARRFDAVILDQRLPDGNGTDWIAELRETHPDIAIIIITGAGDIPLAVEAMRRGADNFLTKPVNMADLEVFLRKSLEVGALRRGSLTRQRLARKLQPYFGESHIMKENMECAALAAENDAVVLLQSETGTGKGVLAQWIHEHSGRSSGPFVEINCSSIRGELFTSELLGHAKGAFTSAVQDRQGLLEVADGGTLFLDEIGDMDLSVQSQFLKIIEEKKFRRLGEVKVRRSDFRLICATNRDLLAETQQGRFRQDLYFRIQIFPLVIPPLRERPEDLPGLVRHLLLQMGAPAPEASPDVLSLLTSYTWPGNIRELKNVLERAVLLARQGPLGPKHFSGLLSPPPEQKRDKPVRNLKKIEEDQIRGVLEQTGGDIEQAVAVLGISRATLYRKLKKMNADS